MIKAVVFDFDGLMFDTEKLWKKSFYKFGKIFHIKLTEENRKNTVGKDENLIRLQLKQEFPNLDVDKYRDEIIKEVDHCLATKKVKAKKGLFELLNYLIANKYKIAIISGSPRYRLNFVVKFYNFNLDSFNFIITSENYNEEIRPKPYPDAFLHCAKMLKVKPSQCVMLEDGYNGVMGANLAGFKSIFIPDTLPPTDDIRQKAVVLKNLSQVVTYLENDAKN